jgi:hypothetical protein
MEEKFKQLCVWPGTVIGEGSIDKFEQFIMDELGVRVKYLTEVKTLPDLENDKYIPDTGGRNDAFFYIHNDDISKFAIPRLNMGIRWWEDVIKYNDNKHLYTKEFLKDHPATW